MIWHSATAEEVLKHYNLDDKVGLSNGECEEKLEIYGENVVSNIEKPKFLNLFLNQLKDKMVIFLIVTAIVSFIVSLAYNEVSSYSAFLIIGIVILNALISAYHKHNCNKTLESIRYMSIPSVSVLREGVVKSVSAAKLVPGDIIILEEGDYISADARIIESNEFRCNELVLTGVEVPVEKSGNVILEDITVVENRSNMVFSGCSVVHGNAKAVVTAVGLETEMGKSSAISQQTGEEKLPLQSKLDVIGKFSNIAIILVCVAVFFVSLIQNFAGENFASITMKTLVNAVALAVAAIPEGLPTISAIVIILGLQRILKDDIVIKNTNAIEVLGKTEILCCDKTGVLTRNKMEVTKIFDGNEICDLTSDTVSETAASVLKLATACSTLDNDSTESAIEKACLTYNSMSSVDIANIFPQVAKVPFDSERKTMSVITIFGKQPVVIVKGAPESVIPACVNCKVDELLKLNETLADEGLRNVCIAMKQLDEIPANPTAEDIEFGLTFVGLIALDDPPREGVVEDIETCESAGIRTVMITGDNLVTAKTVARRIGILKDDTFAITGAELNEMTDEELAENIDKYSVFARVSPSHKLRIIKAWQANKKTVTVTGDNFEDAESLALADVGCAIGRFGTDVAKGNADIIISNNRFHSVLKAIRESRGLFSNIRKSVFYLFSCNIAELIAVLFGLLIFKNMPVAAVQLLWINLLTDCAPAISLSLENAEKDIMNRKGAGISRLFDLKSVITITVQSIYLAFITLIAYGLGNDFNDSAAASTMAFAVLGLSQIFHCFNCKFEGSLMGKKLFANNLMNISVIITLFVILFLLFTPAGAVFSLTALSFSQFIICLLLAISIIPVTELLKIGLNLLFEKTEK